MEVHEVLEGYDPRRKNSYERREEERTFVRYRRQNSVMRTNIHPAPILVVLLLLQGCTGRECLPEPEMDESLPVVSVTVEYTSRETGRESSVTVRGDDEPAIVEADVAAPVVVMYRADDPQGLRELFPRAAVQETVAAAMRRRAIDIPSVESSCPTEVLTETETFPAVEKPREMVLGAAAQNWMGMRAASPSVTVRLR